MKRSKSSHQWLQRHFNDEYVKRARKAGYRSRAVYKLLEVQHKYRILKTGMKVIDLGAAPGSWSQVASEIIGMKGCVIANDILAMAGIPLVEFIQGDFREENILRKMLQTLDNQSADVVISDMSPNISGITAVDQPSAIYLCELALDMAMQVLKPNGTFLVKLFQGQGSDDFLRNVKLAFKTVKIRKPKASNARSREVYVLAQHFKT